MKTTNDLLNTINNITDPDTLDSYLETIKKYENLNYLDYMNAVIEDHKVSKNDIVKTSEINRTYCYQILNGTRKPGRDNAIAISLSAHLTLAETLTFLELLEIGVLYPKNIRDSIIIYAINRNMSVKETNELLYSKNEKTLSE
jgi:hypothetical protein